MFLHFYLFSVFFFFFILLGLNVEMIYSSYKQFNCLNTLTIAILQQKKKKEKKDELLTFLHIWKEK